MGLGNVWIALMSCTHGFGSLCLGWYCLSGVVIIVTVIVIIIIIPAIKYKAVKLLEKNDKTTIKFKPPNRYPVV